MKQQIICPKCFARFDQESRLLICQNSVCKNAGERIPEGSVVFEEGQPLCPDCGREMVMRLCPQCGFEFSGHSPGAKMLGISVVGAEHCGKSHYLTVLVNSLKKELSKTYGCALYPLGGDRTIEQYNKQYYEPLYIQGRCLSPTTQEDVEPLIYSLVFPEGSHCGKTVNLTFYDACGTNFESVRIMEEGNRNIYNSQGILFLVDPTQFGPVRDHRKAAGKPVCDADPATLLSRTIHLIRSGSGQNDIRQKIDIPIAVCITKLDLYRPWLDVSSFVAGASRHLRKQAFNLADFESCNLEMISLIESWGGSELINQVVSQFSSYGFFGFSSLGEEPTPDGKVQHIQPHRVMDPLLWALHKSGAIISTKNEL